MFLLPLGGRIVLRLITLEYLPFVLQNSISGYSLEDELTSGKSYKTQLNISNGEIRITVPGEGVRDEVMWVSY